MDPMHEHMHVQMPVHGGMVADQTLPLLDRGEAAQRLRVSRRTVIRYGHAGLLAEVRIGPKLVKVTAESVEALASAGTRTRKDGQDGATEV